MNSLTERKQCAVKILKALKKLFPHAQCSLQYRNPWELTVAVILSAQCTDRQVNKTTPGLFKKYPRLEDYLHADPKEFEQDIHSCGFFRNKTKHILASAKLVQEKFGGKVPHTMKDILQLPGVARKTANIVLGNAYGVIEGIAVDTHVGRLAKKLGLTVHDSPQKIEKDLMALIPRHEWLTCTYRLIEYGRQYCPARKHDHFSCPLSLL